MFSPGGSLILTRTVVSRVHRALNLMHVASGEFNNRVVLSRNQKNRLMIYNTRWPFSILMPVNYP